MDLDDAGMRAERLGLGLAMVAVPGERGREVPALQLKGAKPQTGQKGGTGLSIKPEQLLAVLKNLQVEEALLIIYCHLVGLQLLTVVIDLLYPSLAALAPSCAGALGT